MRFLNCTFVRGIRREHTSPLFIRQAQVDHLAARHSSTVCQLAERYSIRLNREALISGQDTIDPVTVSVRRISEALVFLACLFHPRHWFALDLF
jgi:hypothetical protein